MINSGTLLIVVNDLDLVEFLGTKLEEIGFQLVFRLSANETIEWLKDNTPLLMVLDFSHPDLNAMDLITDLNQKGVVIPPFIVFTDQGDERIAVEMMKLGAIDYIVKDNLFPERMSFVIVKLCMAIRNESRLRHAEEALMDANILNSQIIESAKEGIIVYGSDMKYRSWNSFMENLTGIPSTEIIGKYPQDLFPFLQENGVIEIIAKALRGETTLGVDVPFDIPKTGKSGWAYDTTAPLFNSAKEIVGAITTVRDISERKKSELLLRETLLDLKKSQQIAQVGSWKLNLTTNEFIASEEALRIFGFSMDYLPKFLEVSDCIHCEDKERVANTLKNALLAREPYNVEMRIFTRDNHQLKYIRSVGEILCNSDEVPIYLIGTNQDITHSKQIENVILESNLALEREKQEKAALINSSSDLIWSLDRNYRLIAANIAFLNSALWFSEGSLKIGDNVLQPDLFSEDLIVFWKGLYDEVLLGNQIRREIFTPTTIHSAVLCFDLNLNPIYNGPDIVGIACFGADITQSKLSEKALKISEEKYRLLFQNMTSGFALHEIILNPEGDPVDYRFLEINPAFERLKGLKSNDIMGKTALEILPETEHYWIESYSKVALTGEPLHFENYSKVLGKFYQVNSYSPKRGQFATVFHDITERKQSENQLKLLSKTIDQSPVIVVITDKNGNVEYANPKFTEISGYQLDDVKGKNVRFLKSGKQDTYFYQELWNTILSGNDWHGEFQNRKKNGDLYWESAVISSIRNSHDEISFFVAIKEDITEKRKMVEELKMKNEELMDKNTFIQTILDNLPIGLALNKFDEGNAMYMNKRFEEIYGWTLAEITSISSFFEKVYPDEDYRRQIVERIMMDINSNDQSKMHWENILVKRKDGTTRIVNAVNIPLIEQNTMVSTVMDITELHHIQNDLLSAKAQAEESDNLKTAFLNNISHEIRTPFNGLLGFLSLIQNNDITNHERDEYIRIINQSAGRLMDTITDVVEISEIQAGQTKLNTSETNIQELLRSLFMRFKPIAEMKGLKLGVKNHMSRQINTIITDRIKLNTILSHLIGNAIKFTNSGSVELIFRLKEDNNQSGMGMPQSIELEFSVTDTGIGIPQEKHLKIFERFIQADTSTTRKFEGSGLGLSIAKTYVEMLGGVIGLASEIGNGTTFYFTVPCICTDLEKSTSEIVVPGIETPSPKKGLNVLVAEDDDASFFLLEIAVRFVAKEVIHAKTGIEAIDFCRSRPDIDLVLMDIKMPDMDGYEATRQIRQFSPNVIIIAQTAYALAGDHERALLAGCNSYISKPVKRDQLLELVQKYFKN